MYPNNNHHKRPGEPERKIQQERREFPAYGLGQDEGRVEIDRGQDKPLRGEIVDDLERREGYPPYPPEGTPRRVSVQIPGVKPIVTYALLAITILVFLLQEASMYAYHGVDIPANLGLKYNPAIVQGEYWRLFTPMFLHGGLLHIGFNMYALYIFGIGLERHYGHVRFLLLYVLSGFAGNVMSFLFSSAPSLGSSTAIFGLLAAEAVFLFQNKKIFGGQAQRALMNIIIIGAVNLAIGTAPGIDNWGHVGGLLGGTLFAFIAGPRLVLEGTYPQLRVQDMRSSASTLIASLLVGAIFTALTVGGIVMYGG